MLFSISISIFKFINKTYWCQFSRKDDSIWDNRILLDCNFQGSVCKIQFTTSDLFKCRRWKNLKYQFLITVFLNDGIFFSEEKIPCAEKSKFVLSSDYTQPEFITGGLQVKECFTPGGMFIINRLFDLPLPLFADEMGEIRWKQYRKGSGK